jgi:ribosomal protein S18 acetylase RimI-like enzyme
MEVIRAKDTQSEWINEIIKEEFPYFSLTPEKIKERMSNDKFIILIAEQGNIDIGFIEVELFLEKKEARLNAIFVEEAWRAQGFAKKMIERVVRECKRKGIERIFLLVKEENENAKALYSKEGFAFEKMHDKIIDGSDIEVWAKKI